jgi:hypothetical protein
MRLFNNLCVYFVVIFSVLMPTICPAKVYTWIGSNGANWDNPSNWRPPPGTIIPNDQSYPSTIDDTVLFDGNALADCKLSDDVEIKAIQCLPGFKRTINLRTYTLSLRGDVDLSHGTIWIQKGNIIFSGIEGTTQIFKPKPGWLYPQLTKTGAGAVQVTGTPLRLGTLNLRSGNWHWAVSEDTVGNLLVTGNAGMSFDNRVNLNLNGKTIDFKTLEKMQIGIDDTLVFCAATDTQTFTPKPGVQFPNIKKVNGGRVKIASNPLKAQALVVDGGTWDFNGKGPDTVAALLTSGGCKVLFNGATVALSEGDADLRGVTVIDGALATLNFIGTEDQYFAAPTSGPPPLIKHTGSGSLIYGVRRAESAIYLFKSRSKSSVMLVPENFILREKGISVEIGMNTYPAALPKFYSDTIGVVGLPIGIMVPIRIPYIVSWVRIKAIFHSSTRRSTHIKTETYVTGTNEILVGKPFFIKNLPYEYTPVIGWGFNNGIILWNIWEKGFKGSETHYYSHYDLGLMVRNQYRVRDQVITGGVMLNWESSFFDPINVTKRINLSLILGY